MTRELLVGVGAVTAADVDAVLDLGPYHPSGHGALQLALRLDGDVIVGAEPRVGFLHRGAEKLFEVRDYRQVIVLANRHDWLSAFCNELGVVLAVERMMGLEVPARAIWLRTLLAELNRVLSALLFLGAAPRAVGVAGPSLAAARETMQAVMEEVSGGRVHYMFNRIGGMKEDVPAGWPRRCRAAVEVVRADLAPLTEVLRSEAFLARTTGVGVLTRDVALSHGASGPVGRASGVDLDLRRDEPYLAYAELGFGSAALPVIGGEAGDSAERFRCLHDQVAVSLDVVLACLDRLPPGPVDVRLPKTVRPPEGATYCWTENPLGLMGYYLVSHGDKVPWRLAMRTASFGNVSVLGTMLPGVALADLVTVLASLSFVVGDLDK